MWFSKNETNIELNFKEKETVHLLIEFMKEIEDQFILG